MRRPGATVCHVDASKGIVAWGKDNAAASGLADRPIRWLVDDCAKFVAREKRRGNTYDGIIMDPPSYGRGPGGEIWKLEDCIYDLISQCEEVLSDQPLFFAVNSYTTGLSPAVMEYMLKTTLVPRFGGTTSCDEIGLPVSATGGVVPCGATAIWEEYERFSNRKGRGLWVRLSFHTTSQALRASSPSQGSLWRRGGTFLRHAKASPSTYGARWPTASAVTERLTHLIVWGTAPFGGAHHQKEKTNE